VIENSKPSQGHYGTWLGDDKPQSQREKLRFAIDEILSDCKSFEDFLTAVKTAGFEIKIGKYISFRGQNQQKFIRLRSLGDDYSEQAIIERIEGKRVVIPKKQEPKKINLMIDIQEKIKQGKGVGYEYWASLFNLKQAAQSLLFLQENNLTDYTEFEKKVSQSTENFRDLSDKIKIKEKRLHEISELQKNISNYSRTREIYINYRKSGYSKKFYAENEGDIILHKTSKKAFDNLGLKKISSIRELQIEYAKLFSEKKRLYCEYRQTKENMQKLLTVKSNIDDILNIKPSMKKHGIEL
jgi:hypothetical protein